MAIRPDTTYPGKINAADANYSYGSARNITAPGDGTGTPLEQAWLNELFGMQQALLKGAGIVPSGAVETQLASQYAQAIAELTQGRAIHGTLSGGPAAYTFALPAALASMAPNALFDGLVIEFQAGGLNDADPTIDAFGLGVKDVWGPNNLITTPKLPASYWQNTQRIRCTYNSVNGVWIADNLSMPWYRPMDQSEYRKLTWQTPHASAYIDSTGVIHSSQNVFSCVRAGIGDYTINFTTAEPDMFHTQDYVWLSGRQKFAEVWTRNYTSRRFRIWDAGVAAWVDSDFYFMIFNTLT